MTLGLVLFENNLFKPDWTSAVLLGLAGPALFKSNIKVFRSLSGKMQVGANLDRLVAGMQQFCFDQINRAFARERIAHKENLIGVDSEALEQKLRTLYAEDYAQIDALIKEQREADPNGVKPLMAELILNRDPAALNRPPDDSSDPNGI